MPAEAAALALPALSPAWRAALLRLGGVWLVLILVFVDDWAAMVRQWLDSSTYNHILLVPPIIGWLVSLRLRGLLQLEPRIWAPGLLLLGAAMVVWVLGSFSGFNLVRQAGAVGLLQASAIVVLGPRVTLGLLFPLAYLVFLIPFGDELVPQLQMITAVLTVGLVHLSGIPAFVEGVFIDTPAGLFEVAEACSGVKFLVAMVALGVLVANVCFRSWRRRVLFMALCVVAPILANGLRAWGTIYVAQYVGAERAGGFDHIVYGWFFFAFVVAAVLAIAWRYFDRAIDDQMIDPVAIKQRKLHPIFARGAMPAFSALLLSAVLVGGGQAWARAAERLSASPPRQIFLPEVAGWQIADYAPGVPWQPRADGSVHQLLGRYRDGRGRSVDVFLALYPDQNEGREASGYGQGALPADGEWSWNGAGPAAPGGKSDILRARGTVERLAITYYRNGELLTGSALRLKLATVADRLALRREPTVMLILSTETADPAAAAQTLAEFRAATGPTGPWVDRIVAVR